MRALPIMRRFGVILIVMDATHSVQTPWRDRGTTFRPSKASLLPHMARAAAQLVGHRCSVFGKLRLDKSAEPCQTEGKIMVAIRPIGRIY